MRVVPILSAAALAAAAVATLTTSPVAAEPDVRSAYTFVVIGDVPYGGPQIAKFPGWIDQINADRAVRHVVHVGDIKNGSSSCTDAYFDLIRADFDRFEDPLVYTPGDNEWTDCHRPVSNGPSFDPLERLAALREVFFPEPGRTLGQKQLNVSAQDGFPENVVYHLAEVTFVTAHVVGSNNSMVPWTGNTEATTEQMAEVEARTAADIANLHRAFAEAVERGDRGVVVLQQADMFDPSYTPEPADIDAFTPWVQALVDEASAYDGPVYLFDGDSHVYNVDQPLATGSAWLTTYRVSGSADNLTRVTVDGSANNTDYLWVTVNKPDSATLLSWEQVPYLS